VRRRCTESWAVTRYRGCWRTRAACSPVLRRSSACSWHTTPSARCRDTSSRDSVDWGISTSTITTSARFTPPHSRLCPTSATCEWNRHLFCAQWIRRASAVTDGPAWRAASGSRISCYMQKWMLSVINCPSSSSNSSKYCDLTANDSR